MWFKEEKISDDELQVRLKALCDKVIAQQYSSIKDMEIYEALLREIYRRNLTPAVKLTPKNEQIRTR